MKTIISFTFICAALFLKAQVEDFEFKLYDTSEEVVPLRKTSQTIGKCCQLGKAMSKLTGGLSDVYLTQSELNNDGSHTVFL